MGRNPNKFLEEKKKITLGVGRKNISLGVSQFEIFECCYAKLTPSRKVLLSSQILRSHKAPGQQVEGELRWPAEMECWAALAEGSLGAQSAGGKLYLVLAASLCQSVSFHASGHADVKVE